MAKSIFGNSAVIESAGSKPSGQVQPWAIEILKQDGIDISKNSSKSTDQLPPAFLANLDYVVTLCAEEVCPMLSSKAKRVHWPIPDPALSLEPEMERAFQSAKDEIRNRLILFKTEISNRAFR